MTFVASPERTVDRSALVNWSKTVHAVYAKSVSCCLKSSHMKLKICMFQSILNAWMCTSRKSGDIPTSEMD